MFMASSFAVLFSLFAAALRADERFEIYRQGGQFGTNPLTIVRGAIGEIPTYVRLGNFRPIGRIVDYLEHSAAYQLSVATHVPVNVVHGMFRWLAVAILGAVALALVRQYLPKASTAYRTVQLVFVLAFAAHVVVAGALGPPLLFPWLYLVTTAMGLGLAVLLGGLARPGAAMSWRWAIGLAFAGAVIASTNELATAGIAIALFHVLLLSWVKRLPLWNPAMQGWLITLAGFAAVFVPVRIIIARTCAAATCYAASDLALSTWTPEFFLSRLISGILPVTWDAATDVSRLVISPGRLVDFLVGYGGLLIGLGIAAVFVIHSKLPNPHPNTNNVERVDTRALIALAALGVGIAAAGATIASLSRGLQDLDLAVGLGWRESGFGFAGWSIVATILLAGVLNLFEGTLRRVAGYVVAGALVLAITITSLLNGAVTNRFNVGSEAMLNNQIASSLTAFDTSEFGNEYRCSLLDAWSNEYHDKNQDYRPAQMTSSLNVATNRTFGRDYCVRE